MLRVNTEEVKCEWHTRENLCVSAQTDKMWSKKKLKSQNIFFCLIFVVFMLKTNAKINFYNMPILLCKKDSLRSFPKGSIGGVLRALK